MLCREVQWIEILHLDKVTNSIESLPNIKPKVKEKLKGNSSTWQTKPREVVRGILQHGKISQGSCKVNPSTWQYKPGKQ